MKGESTRFDAMRRFFALSLAVLLAASITSCSGSDGDSSNLDLIDDVFSGDSVSVSLVKDSYVKACPTATLGEMASAFMSGPEWRDFIGTSGNTIVELKGGISFDNMPADALIQFEVSGGSFEAVYLGINDADQSLLMLSTLLTKMCDAT